MEEENKEEVRKKGELKDWSKEGRGGRRGRK